MHHLEGPREAGQNKIPFRENRGQGGMLGAARGRLRAWPTISAYTGVKQGWQTRGAGVEIRSGSSPQGTETGHCRSAPQWC